MLLAFLVLCVSLVPMLVIAVSVRLTSKGGALFIQHRVGAGGRLFRMYKFRSMRERPRLKSDLGLTKNGDQRVTGLGRFLRKLKLDELPQFINVLRGDMALVGPRPKLPQFAAIRRMPYRPGITGPATIAFRHEEDMLRNIDPDELENFYAEKIKPVKARLDVCYMCRATPSSDLRIIASTFLACLVPRQASRRTMKKAKPMDYESSEGLPSN